MTSDQLKQATRERFGALRQRGADLGSRLGPETARFRPAWERARSKLRAAAAPVRAWLAEPGHARRAGWTLVAVLVVIGLLLPPVSLVTRVTTLGYAKLTPGRDQSVRVDDRGTYFEVARRDLQRPTRVDVQPVRGLPRGTGELPAGRQLASPVYRLDIRGPVPETAWLSTILEINTGTQPFVDPYGWDGEAWRWLPMAFDGENRVRVRLPLDRFVPEYIAITQVDQAPTEVSAALLPPPAAVPAAVSELPILEARAYTLKTDDGHVAGQRFRVPSRRARLYGIVDNLEGERLRSDLIDNILINRQARQRHRETLVNLARRDGLAGIVLDYRGIAGDLVPVYIDWLARLRDDLHRQGAELYVTVPMPRRTETGWDDSPYNWDKLAPSVDGLRVRLQGDTPLEIEALDGLVRWALTSVPRDKLQLALPVQGRDIVEGEATPISYGDALARILDLARSDAPDRITPGTAAAIELPTIRASELGRDPATGMWKFHYWDANRRQHTVWLNDADGLKPAFDIARQYFLSRLVLDGVEAGLDPSLWRMTQAFIAEGAAQAPETGYRLQWQLVDADGQVVQSASQPVETPEFAFRAPDLEGRYRLGVNLVTRDERLAAVGNTFQVNVAPPPPPTPRPTTNTIIIQPTPMPVVTAAAPADEAVARAPVRFDRTPEAASTEMPDAEVSFAEADLRSDPAIDTGEVLSGLRMGDRLKVVGRTADGSWLRVVVIGTGIEGWVFSELVDLNLDAGEVPIMLLDEVTPSSVRPPTAGPPATRTPRPTRTPGG